MLKLKSMSGAWGIAALLALSGCSQDFKIKSVTLPDQICVGNTCVGNGGSTGGSTGTTSTSTTGPTTSTSTTGPTTSTSTTGPTTSTSTTGPTTSTSTTSSSTTSGSSQFSQEFNPSQISVKKVDLVLVIDNSGSMATEQSEVANGLGAVASAYFAQPGLDICISVISSTRYLYASSASIGAQERNLGCSTSNAGAAATSAFITSVKDSILNLGTGGSGQEMLGKSLVSFLANKSSFHGASNSVDSAASLSLRTDSNFRPDATKAVVFVTDENNYFGYSQNGSTSFLTYESWTRAGSVLNNLSSIWYTSASGSNLAGDYDPSLNDLPAILNQVRPLSSREADAGRTITDSRKGIKEYLAGLFDLTKTTVLSFLKLNSDGSLAPFATGPNMGAVNLFPLPSAIGNGSLNASIDGFGAADVNAYYVSKFNSLFQNAYSIQSRFTLLYAISNPATVVVEVIHGDGTRTGLSQGADFSIAVNNTVIQLSAAAAARLVPTDSIVITYDHR